LRGQPACTTQSKSIPPPFYCITVYLSCISPSSPPPLSLSLSLCLCSLESRQSVLITPPSKDDGMPARHDYVVLLGPPSLHSAPPSISTQTKQNKCTLLYIYVFSCVLCFLVGGDHGTPHYVSMGPKEDGQGMHVMISTDVC
jgi:hypothetical protein